MHTILIAQTSSGLSAVPADQLKWTLVILFALLGAAGVIFGIVRGVIKQHRTIDGQPIEIKPAPDLVTKEFCLSSHQGIHSRLDGHDHAIAAIRAEMKHDRESSENAARVRSAGHYKKLDDVRIELTEKLDEQKNQMTKGFADLERAIGRLEGQR